MGVVLWRQGADGPGGEEAGVAGLDAAAERGAQDERGAAQEEGRGVRQAGAHDPRGTDQRWVQTGYKMSRSCDTSTSTLVQRKADFNIITQGFRVFRGRDVCKIGAQAPNSEKQVRGK